MAVPRKSKAPARAPAFLAGYIEGYYGRLLTFAERAGLAEKLGAIGAGYYLYAPKEDPFHRHRWKEPYPAAWKKEFSGFVRTARRRGVRVLPGLAPGLSYRYRRAEDFAALERKFLAFAASGCEEAVLLMDDIPVELPKADAGAFRSLGEAHGQMLRRLQARLCRPGGLRRLWFCPTVYSDYFAPEGIERDAYLRDLAALLPPEIEWMWTGPAIVSRALTPRNLAAVTRVLGRPPVIWDNYYAQDYCPGRLFLGAFRDRPEPLRRAARGLLLNPTGYYHTDLFLLDLLGGFLRGAAPETSWKEALARQAVPREFLTVAPILASPFVDLKPRALGPAKVQALRRALKPLIWDWKSPLQREWYPFLYALDADLRLLLRDPGPPDPIWIRKKYSPILSQLLLENPAFRE